MNIYQMNEYLSIITINPKSTVAFDSVSYSNSSVAVELPIGACVTVGKCHSIMPVVE